MDDGGLSAGLGIEGRREGALWELGGRRDAGGVGTVGRRGLNAKGVVRSIISSSAKGSGCGQTNPKSVFSPGIGDTRVAPTCTGDSPVCGGGASR